MSLGYNSIPPINFGTCVNGGTYSTIILIYQGEPITALVLSGPDAAHFGIITGVPIPSPPPQKQIQISFSPNASRVFNATLTYTYIVGGKPFHGTFALTGTGIAAGNPEVGFNFNSIAFPASALGTPITQAGVTLVNLSNISITVNTLAFGGADFTVLGGPVLPLVLAPAGSSAPFTIQFNPSVLGSETDVLTATLAGGNTGIMNVSGSGLQISPVFDLTGATQATIFGFSGANFSADPDDFDTEEPGQLVRASDGGFTNFEKQLMRVKGHYQDFGPAEFTVTVQNRRVGQPNSVVSKVIDIGTIAATDGWIREFMADLDMSGEIIQITISRAAASGPAFIIDYAPVADSSGDVIEGT